MLYQKMLPAAFLFITFNCSAQVQKIDTDRPDQTESPFTIPKKYVQFELGLNMERINAGETEFLLPTILSKYGLTKRIELRLITTVKRFPVIRSSFSKQYEAGLEPVELGAKIALAEEKKWLPKTSLIFHFAMPPGASNNLRPDRIAPNFRFTMQNTISEKMGIAYNIGAEWDGYSNRPAWIYTLSPGFNLGEKWYAYAEVFGSFAKEMSPQHNIDGGLAYYVSTDLKIDISSGFGISANAPSRYLAVGASVRFNTRH